MYDTPLFVCTVASVLLYEAAIIAWVDSAPRPPRRISVRILATLVWLGYLGWRLVGAIRTAINPAFREVRPVVLWATALFVVTVGCVVLLHLAVRHRIARQLPPISKSLRWPLTLATIAIGVLSIVLIRGDLQQAGTSTGDLAVAVYDRYAVALNAGSSANAEPSAVNAAPLYVAAFAKMDAIPQDDRHLIEDALDPDGPPNWASVEQCLSAHADIIGQLRQFGALPYCRFDEDSLRPQIDIQNFHLEQERFSAELLRDDAAMQRKHGEVAMALSDAAAILYMSRKFAHRPTTEAGLYGTGIHEYGLDALRKALPFVKSAVQLNAIDADSLWLKASAFQLSLRGEAVYQLAMLLTVGTGHYDAGKVAERKAYINPLESTPNYTAMQAVTVAGYPAMDDLLDTICKALPQPYYQMSSCLHDPAWFKDQGICLRFEGPALVLAVKQWYKCQARDQCAQVAIAMTRYRLDHGKLPMSLSALVPAYLAALPVGPFTGQPVSLIVRDGQWIIYNVGADGIDHGGVGNYLRGDIVFPLTNDR
jgi:hypothetical protein